MQPCRLLGSLVSVTSLFFPLVFPSLPLQGVWLEAGTAMPPNLSRKVLNKLQELQIVTSCVTHCGLGRRQSQLMKRHLYSIESPEYGKRVYIVERGMFARGNMSMTPKHLHAAQAHFSHCHHQKKGQNNAIPRCPPPDFWPDASAPKPPAKEVQGLARQEDSTTKSRA